MRLALALLFTIGLAISAVLAFLWGIKEALSESDVMSLILGIIMAGSLGFLALVPMGLYESSTSPTFELEKSEWICSEDHTETVDGVIMVDKVMVPTSDTVTVCDNYRRKGR